MDTKQLEALGIDAARGGRVQVIAGVIESVSDSTSKDGVKSTYVDVSYQGGTESLRLDPSHPLTRLQTQTEVVIAFSWTDTKWGTRPHDVRLLNGPKAA